MLSCTLALMGILSAEPAQQVSGDGVHIAQQMADRARDLARDGDIAQALSVYENALALDPNSMDIRRDYAVTLGSPRR